MARTWAQMVAEAQARVGMEIRSNHPAAFKSGQWGEIVGVKKWPEPEEPDTRWCYVILWPDGADDLWPIHDPVAEYQFRGEPLTFEAEPEPPETHPGHAWDLVFSISRLGMPDPDKMRIHCSCGWRGPWKKSPPEARDTWALHIQELG